jgi:chromosome segregation ATPase
MQQLTNPIKHLKEAGDSQIMTIVADENTGEMNGKRPFEERVFARFDTIDSRLNGVDARFDTVDSSISNLDSRLEKLGVRADDTNSRLEKLEIRAYDTKPIWEQALKEIVDTRRELSKRLARIEAVVYETRSDLRDVEDRLEKIEPKPTQ